MYVVACLTHAIGQKYIKYTAVNYWDIFFFYFMFTYVPNNVNVIIFKVLPTELHARVMSTFGIYPHGMTYYTILKCS